MQVEDSIEVATGEHPSGSVIWLHGLGADGHDFEALVPELRLPTGLGLRFVFPHAPIRPVTVNGGMQMRAWYDIVSFDAAGRADAEGVRASAVRVTSLIEREIERGIPSERIVVAGFSQGGAVAIHTALRSDRPLAGLLALSTYLPLADAFKKEAAAGKLGDKALPIFMAHGLYDPVLPLALGEASMRAMIDAGFNVDWHTYPMAHAVCAEEITDIRRWLLTAYGE